MPFWRASALADALVAAAALLLLGFVIVGHAGSLGVSPYYGLLIGMVVQGLGWGLVETVINPLTSALYPEDRVSRLSILHAWYPAGVVGGALIGIVGDRAGLAWRLGCMCRWAAAASVRDMAVNERLPEVEPLHRRAGDAGRNDPRHHPHRPTIFLWVVLMMFTASTEFAPGQWVDVALSARSWACAASCCWPMSAG